MFTRLSWRICVWTICDTIRGRWRRVLYLWEGEELTLSSASEKIFYFEDGAAFVTYLMPKNPPVVSFIEIARETFSPMMSHLNISGFGFRLILPF